MRILITVLYSLFSGWWRRCFGSDGWELPVLKNRFVQHLIGSVAGLGALYFCGYSWIRCVLAVGVLQGWYWAVGHGPAFDMSRAGYPDETLLKRYKKYFWNKWCEYLVPVQSWYGFGYDFLWMLFRYGCPAFVLSIILWQPYIAFAGLTTTIIYALCWGFEDHKVLKKFGPTELAEILAGVVTGLLLTL